MDVIIDSIANCIGDVFNQTLELASDEANTKNIIVNIAKFFDSDIMKIFTGIAAIAAFLISTVDFVYLYHTRRKRITIYFGKIIVSNYTIKKNDINGIERDFHIVKIPFRVDNRSQLPISITRIGILIDGIKYDSEPRPHVAEIHKQKMGKELDDKIVIHTDVLPIYLDSLAAHFGYLAFLIPPNILSGREKALNFQICTNRGKAVEKTFALYEDHQLG